jgi:nucleotide-binding universal stress UspA family protein
MNDPIRCILAATDLSEASRVALRRAAQLARQHGARLELMHVVRSAAVLPDWLARAQPRLADEEDLKAELRGRLTAMAVEAGIEGSIKFDLEVRFGKPAQLLAERAHELQADLLVVGAHGESGLVESMIGTTAQKVVRLSRIAVLVAKRAADGPYRRMLVSTDFSDSAKAAAHLAHRLAPDAALELFTAYDVPYFTLMTHAGVSDDAMGDYRKLAHDDAQTAMDTFLADLGPPFADSHPVLRHGYAPPLIQQYVEEQPIDLVAVGAQGKGAISATLLGSVSSRVLAESRCDVLVVRAD